MKLTLLQKAIIAIGVVPVLVILIALILPKEFTIKRSIDINASSEKVFPYISDLRAWEQWSTLQDQDSTLEFSYEGSSVGIGAVQKWDGELTGKGSVTITGSDPRKGIDYNMTMSDGNLKLTGSIYFKMLKSGDLELVWTGTGNMSGNPLMRYFGLLVDSALGPDYEKGLRNLRELVENKND